MEDGYFKAIISATSEEEAKRILSKLLKKRLVAGGLIAEGPSLYWWKRKITSKIYFSISAYTTAKHRAEIIRIVERMHKDETPILEFYKVDYGNKKFIKWVGEYVKNTQC